MTNENQPQHNNKKIPIISSRMKKMTTTVLLVVVALYLASAYQTDATPDRIIEGFPNFVLFFIEDMWPPNWGYFDTAFFALLETWNIAFLATTLTAIFTLPIAFLAANNVNKNAALYHFVRLSLNVLRTIPDLVWAVLFVAIVGLGALSGMLALFFFSLGILIKFVSETIEAIDDGPMDAIRASGGNTLQVIMYGAIPQFMPQFISYTLYVLEINVRASIVLGFVGAGGIGYLLQQQLSVFRYDNISTVIVITFLGVTLIDWISTVLRKRLV
ncbi:phosphonate transport system permease protein [Salsuginibacillus halophilus]|uniref:Phosphonate transport system permease protein n=1 Tax=Salsuginibacillus halophilus TaxID=517424 RepID=A0A2P8HWM7_9BACI|nr:phosphonate ABC transporter, permease protein PhnE [Salsuginibacillus halophilus]PSL50620.1 phosphonate transport system permease protein [Salsuginibacillus halophilus]